MQKLSDQMFRKAEGVIFGDKLKMPTEVTKIVSNEIYYVLSQYFEMKSDSYKSSVFVEKDGELNIYFSFKANRILMKRHVIN